MLKYSKNLPLKVKVCKGFLGVNEETAINTGNTLHMVCRRVYLHIQCCIQKNCECGGEIEFLDNVGGRIHTQTY